ncbi:MAG TPA: quinoprotein dehydrogenase-associated SoxYZ-like carrier [Lamprocystis sp. (in: g-proteobacteria)]|nr:quinoprotein dehydrogenase-associated SoxYZ-like carrier [Lamprocystis sp. (in: g-proteobacteria)]
MTTVSQSAHRPEFRVWPGAWVLLLAMVLLGGLGRVRAEQTQVDPDQARWGEIRSALFGDRPVADGKDLLQLSTPYRAEDAAVVPVSIKPLLDPTAGRNIQDLYLIIDMNPVPLAATFHFPGAQPWDEIATRIRVNAYSNVRAVARTDDGQLHMVANYVKASGGCSAPSIKDPAAAAAQIGRMKLVLPERVNPGERLAAQFLIKHPNNSGLQFDQVSRQFIPADYVKHIAVSYQGQPLFTADTNISISEDPSIRFGLIPAAAATDLSVQVQDSTGRAFEQTFPVVPSGG